MATKTLVCPECAAALVPGRLSCSACGALVASVASGVRTFAPEPVLPPVLRPVASAVAVEEPPAHNAAAHAAPSADDAPPGEDGSADADEPFDENAPLRAAVEVARGSQDWDHQPVEPEQVSDAVAEPEAIADEPEPPAVEADAPATPEQADVVDEAELDDPEPVPQVAAVVATPTAMPDVLSSEPKWPENPTWPPTSLNVAASAAPLPATRALAGAYLPPSAVLPPGDTLPIANGANGSAAAIGGSAAVVHAAAPSLASRFRLGDADGPLGLPDDAAARTVAAGAGIAAFSFILPWAEVVIGSRAMGSYIDSWGLAGPGHALVLLALLGVAGIALAAERLPKWVGAGLPAIVLAAFIAGIAWPYLVGPFRPAIGVYVVVIGAVILGVGGLLVRAGQRHAEPLASV